MHNSIFHLYDGVKGGFIKNKIKKVTPVFTPVIIIKGLISSFGECVLFIINNAELFDLKRHRKNKNSVFHNLTFQ